MAVDDLRENFHINRVKAEDVEDFLSAQTYRPEITTAYKKISSFRVNSLQSLCSEKIRQGPTPVYAEAGDLCFKSKHTVDLIAEIDESDFVDPFFSENHASHKVQCNDFVITRKGAGTIGRVSIFFGAKPLNTDDSLFKVSVKKADSSFVAVFLKTYWGERLLEKGVYGSTGQLSLSSGHIRNLPIIQLAETAQKYIGNKVRQAETLRAWAKRLKNIVDKKLDNIVPSFDKKIVFYNRLPVGRLHNRLDPRPYRSHFLSLYDSLLTSCKTDQINTIAHLSSGDPVPSDIFSEEQGIPLVRIRNIYPDKFTGLDTFVSQNYAALRPETNAKANRIVVGMDGVFRAQFFLEEELPMHINQRVAILDAHSIRPELLTHWLNRPEGQMQLNQWAVKTTVEHTSLSDIAKIIVPRLTEPEENFLADQLTSVRRAIFLSTFLTTAAKILTEAIIEQKLTEQDLINAQQALDKGDTSLDRNILSRLTTTGLDNNDSPLFPDLDQLYQLLEQAVNPEAGQ